MSTILSIIGVFIVLVIVLGLVALILARFPIIKYTAILGVGIATGLYYSSWWGGIGAGFAVMLVIEIIQAMFLDRCANCGSYDTSSLPEDHTYKYWHCRRCGTVTRKFKR